MWDYLIIGAGSAGCVLAHDLSADPRNRVLLIEAGKRPPLMSRIPAGFVKLFKSAHDWNFESEPQQACGGRTIYVPRGKMLGGCSSINAQVHQWCHPADFDGWADLGAAGWSWDEVTPVFRAMERCSLVEANPSRGREGAMRIARPRLPCVLADRFVEAARNAGLAGPPDYNGCTYSGAWRTEQAHDRGSRFSIFDSYLKPAMSRRNLEVMTGAQAAAILFDGRRAVGVRLVDGRQLHGARIIVSAGAIGSPQLLMLSGVGPTSQLSKHGIPVVYDSPQVGLNLQDHPLIGLSFAARDAVTLKSADTIGQLLRWLLLRRGLLSSNGIEAIAFTSVADPKGPDLELIFANLEWRNQGLDPPQVHAFSIATGVVAPKSRGCLSLRSPEPADAPQIDFGLLSDPGGIDRRVLLAGLKLTRKIAATPPLAGETSGELPETSWAQSDEELDSLINRDVQTIYHPAGTCRMGNDEGAPLDSRLKVRGCESLWVVDASVMPTVPRGHPNAVVAMIARRAAGWLDREPKAAVPPIAA